jgi:uncharacterized membrane protein (DUF4010 family)
VALTRWWQLAIGVVVGTLCGIYLPGSAFTIALVVGFLLAWSSLRNDGDDAMTAIGAGFLTWVVMIFMAGASDRVLVFLGISYISQMWFYRVAVWIAPFLVGFLAWRFCLALRGMEEVQAEQEAAVRSAQPD